MPDKTEVNVEPHCDVCEQLGYYYEGGLSMNPEIDNKARCHCQWGDEWDGQ